MYDIVYACEMEGGWVRNVHMYDINVHKVSKKVDLTMLCQ